MHNNLEILWLRQALVARHGPRKEQAALQAMDAAASIVSESDLVLTGLALRFCTTLLRQQRTLGPHVTQRVLPPALTLLRSPLMQVWPAHTDISMRTRLLAKGR